MNGKVCNILLYLFKYSLLLLYNIIHSSPVTLVTMLTRPINVNSLVFIIMVIKLIFDVNAESCERTEINLGSSFEPSDAIWDNDRQVNNQ